MAGTLAAALLLAYAPGALLYRLPFWHRDRRAALDAEERVFWHLAISVSWSLSVVLALAALDQYSFTRLLWINGGLCLALLVAGRQHLRYTQATRVTWTAVLPVLLVGLACLRFSPVSEYIIGGRDPGVLFNEGIQIAQRGSLVIRDRTIADVPPFARDLFFPAEHRADYHGSMFMGMFIQDPDTGQSVGQFPQLLPASIAVAYGLDGLTGGRRAIAWWATLGLLSVYFLAARLFGRGAAFCAAALLALNVVQVWYGRYPNSDVVFQAGVFAALLALGRAIDDDQAWFGPLAAWLLGLQLFNRVDALLVILPCAAAVVLRWIAAPGRRLGWRFVLPMAAWTAIGMAYLTGPMRAYYIRAAEFLANLPSVQIAIGLAAAVLFVLVGRALRPRIHASIERWIPLTLVGTLAVLALYAMFVRTPGGRLLAADAYALRDFVSIYLGVGMFALALVGLTTEGRREFWRHPAFFLTFAAFSLFFFYKLKIVHEHFWMARRFLGVILPGALILGSAAAFGTLQLSGARRVAAQTAGAIVLAVTAFQYSTAAAAVMPHVEYRNMIPYVEQLAERFGPRDLIIVESRDSGSDLHVLGLPLAYIYAKPVLVLRHARPDRLLFRQFLEDALTRYERVFFVGTGGTTLLSRQMSATPVASDRVQIDEFEVTTDRLPTQIHRKEFDYGVYQLTLGIVAAEPFSLDVGERDDLHVLRFHAKEHTEGRSIRWTQDASELAVSGLTGQEREVILTMSDGGRPAGAAPASVEVFFAGIRLGIVDVLPGFRDYRFAIPADAAEAAARSDEPATLRLVSTVWSPRAILKVPDDRELGVMLDAVAVR